MIDIGEWSVFRGVQLERSDYMFTIWIMQETAYHFYDMETKSENIPYNSNNKKRNNSTRLKYCSVLLLLILYKMRKRLKLIV